MYGLLAEVALKSVVVLALGFVAALVLRRASAAVRHFAWLVVMFALLLLPLFCLRMPAYEVAMPATLVTRVSAPARQEAVPKPISGAAAVTEAHARATLPVGPLLAGLWAVGCGAGLLHFGLTAWRVRRRFGAADEAPEAIVATARGVVEGLGLGKVPAVRRGDVTVPMTMGNMIVLPSEAADWSDSRLRTVLTHEVAHIRRHDWAAQMAGEIVCRLYWFNPLAWLAAERMRSESERAADDAVLRAGAAPSDYAEVLLALAQAVPRRQLVAALSIVRKSRIPGRLRRILAATVSGDRSGCCPRSCSQ